MPADKHKNFLQVDSITLGVRSQACPKYPKWQLYNICAISQGKLEEWSWFFSCWKASKVSSKWYYRFRCVWPGMSKLLKITSLLFLCNILRKKWVMMLIFCMQISMKARSDTMILMVMVKHSQSSQTASLQCLYNISKKKLISTLWASKFSTRW